jgi:2'-5' RNA ligase
MTLAFLGACGETVAHRALAALDERLARAPVGAFPISFGAVVPMGGSRQGYTALSALLERGRDRATEILTAHRDPLYEAAGRKPERRPPKPHVTLARPQRRASDDQRRAGLAWAADLDLSGVEQRIDRIALYTWSDERPRQLFRIVASRPLG